MALSSETTIHPALYKSLEGLGLTAHERNLYCLSVTLGPASVASLAKHLQISQPNVYKVIRGLEVRGLAVFTNKKGYTKRFMVEPPTVVADLVRAQEQRAAETQQQLMSAMPDLLAIYKQGDLPTKAVVLQGKQQLSAAFARVYEEARGEVLYFGSAEHFMKFLGPELGDLRIEQRVAKKLPVRGLVTPSEHGNDRFFRDQEKELRTMRVMRGFSPFTTSFHLFAHKILLWQPHAPLALLIEDEYIITMFRSMFEWVWERSGK
jgi:sugar-specific transcriptional regulator TrmB